MLLWVEKNRADNMSFVMSGIALFDASFSPVFIYIDPELSVSGVGNIKNNTRPRITASILMQGCLNSS